MIPIDKEQCQAEKPNGATFMSMGGVPKMIRCTNKPTVIATETQAGADGKKGSMTLCDNCLKVASEQLPVGFFYIVPISNIIITVHQFKNEGYCLAWKSINAKHLVGMRHYTALKSCIKAMPMSVRRSTLKTSFSKAMTTIS